MAEKKTIRREIEVEVLETGNYLLRDGQKDVIRAALAAAAELQASGVRLDRVVSEDIEISMGYDTGHLRDNFALRVPAESQRPLRRAPNYIPNNLTLEQLFALRDAVFARIEESEQRLVKTTTPAPTEPEVDIVTAKSARVRALSTSPEDVIAAANLARRTLLVARNDAGLSPMDADAGISLAVATDPRRVIVTARYPSMF